LWLAIVAAGVIEAPASSPAAAPLGIALTAQTVLFAILGGVQAVVTWRGDLVEPRRRLRLFVVGATAVYIFVNAATGFLHTGPVWARAWPLQHAAVARKSAARLFI
jgi:hypothetical protein